jgi:hypothetical protein
MLASMRNDPVATQQLAGSSDEMLFKEDLPNLSHFTFHSPVLCLPHRKLKTLRLAGTFWIGRRITYGTIGSRIHIFHS